MAARQSLAAALKSVLGTGAKPAPQRTRFEGLLEQHEQARQKSLAAGPLGLPRVAWNADPAGYMPLDQAAAEMGVTVDELRTMAGRGMLEARERWGEIEVRPAIVSVLGVEQPRDAA